MNIGNGSCGTADKSIEDIAAKRTEESKEACGLIGAVYHESICNDLEIYHTTKIVSRVVSVVRTVRPAVILTSSPQDYMEDHINASRIAVTAAFARGMLNYPCEPCVEPVSCDTAVYHALPYGLKTPLRKTVRAGQYVDISSVIDTKRKMLACHSSQKEWLDTSQGMNAYLNTMDAFSREAGRMSGQFECAEGWRRRLHLGFSAQEQDPISAVLGNRCFTDPEYEKSLDT
jgi:LmbE family N-acetylglucosaminyl deacetylase